MTIQYKNSSVSLTDTNLNTVLTIATSAVAIVKSVYFSNASTGSIICNASLHDTSAGPAQFEFFRDSIDVWLCHVCDRSHFARLLSSW